MAACTYSIHSITTCSSPISPKKIRSSTEAAIREAAMQGYVAQKLNEFETGKISRRRLIETLTLAATTAYAADSANAASPRDAALIHHISYPCPDFKKAADWYSMVFNLDQVGTTAHDTALPFGKKGDQP